MRKHTALVAVVLALLLSACGVTRRQGTSGEEGASLSLSKSAFLHQHSAMESPAEVQGTGRVFLRKGSESTRVPVSYSMVRDRSVVLSVRPLPFVEAGRVDVTNDAILVQDRMNRRYFRASLSRRGHLGVADLAGIDPAVLWAVAQNEPFTKRETGVEVLRSMKMHTEGGLYVFENKREGIRHEYDDRLRLIHSIVEVGVGRVAEVRYEDFSDTGVPMTTILEVTDIDKVYGAELRLNSLGDKVKAQADTTPPAKYREVSLKELTELLKNL